MRVLNKTPSQNEYSNVYEIEEVNQQIVKNIILSRFIADGIYSIEQYSSGDYSEVYLSSPSFDKFQYQKVSKKWEFDKDIANVSVYELVLEKPMFMPLDTNNFADLLNKVAKKCNFPVFLQVLLSKRRDNWRETAISQYESFLKGNENFINFKPIDRIQEGLLKVFNKIGGFKLERDPIDEIEKKILQENVRFECRLVLFDSEKEGELIREIYSVVDDLTLFNRWELKKVKDVEDMLDRINRRRFSLGSVNQLLSQQEVYSLLCDSGQVHVETKLNTSRAISLIKTMNDNTLLQKAISLMPKSNVENKEVDQEKVTQLNNVLKRVGITKKTLKANEVYQGSTILKVQLTLPPDIMYSSVKKKLVDIQAALGNESVSIEIGDKPDTVNIFIPIEKRSVLYIANILNSPEFNEFKKESHLPFIIGDSANGGYIFGCLSKFRHILVAGTSGSGKSFFVNLILLSLILNVPSDHLLLYLVDPKMVEFTQFEGFPQTKEIITDMKKANNLLISLCEEMDNRYEMLSKEKVKDIQSYNLKANEKLPFIVVAIDELADLMMVNGEVEDQIVRIAQKGRACGIHLILATQRPSVDVVTGLIKANMPVRFAFKTTSGVDSKTVIDTVGAEKLMGLGDGLARVEGSQREIERFQAPALTLDKTEEDEIFEELKLLYTDLPSSERELTVSTVVNPIDKLRQIISETGKTKVSDLQEEMGIAIGKVTDLMKQLVDEGFLSRDGRSYIINAHSEEDS